MFTGCSDYVTHAEQRNHSYIAHNHSTLYDHDQCNNKTKIPSVFITTEFCDNSVTWWARVWFLVRVAPFFSTSLLEPVLEPTQLPVELLWRDLFANLGLMLSLKTHFIFAPSINLDSVMFSYYGYHFEFQNELSQVYWKKMHSLVYLFSPNITLNFTKYIVLHLLFLGRVYPRKLTVWKHNKQRGKDGSLYA